jgi:Beta-lactamase superfamily domain
MRSLRLTLLGVGAMNSPRYAPAGLLVKYTTHRVMIDGGPGAEPAATLNSWLVTDDQGELIREIRKLARREGVEPKVGDYSGKGILIKSHRVVHTAHRTYGYVIEAEGKKIVWAPEFFKFPRWADSADLMFAEAAGWSRPIRFRGGVEGHACAIAVARLAQLRGVKRLVFAHIGRPTITAIDAGRRPSFGEFGRDGEVYFVSRAQTIRRRTRTQPD